MSKETGEYSNSRKKYLYLSKFESYQQSNEQWKKVIKGHVLTSLYISLGALILSALAIIKLLIG